MPYGNQRRLVLVGRHNWVFQKFVEVPQSITLIETNQLINQYRTTSTTSIVCQAMKYPKADFEFYTGLPELIPLPLRPPIVSGGSTTIGLLVVVVVVVVLRVK